MTRPSRNQRPQKRDEEPAHDPGLPAVLDPKFSHMFLAPPDPELDRDDEESDG